MAYHRPTRPDPARLWPIVAGMFIAGQTAASCDAQITISADVRPRDGTALSSEAKLAPELAVAAESGATFQGLDRENAAILTFPHVDAVPEVRRSLERLRTYELTIRREIPRDRIDDARAARSDTAPKHAAGPPRNQRNSAAEIIVLPRAGRELPSDLVIGADRLKKAKWARHVLVAQREGFSAGQLQRIARHPDIEVVEPNYAYAVDGSTTASPGDEHLRELWWVEHTGAMSAWAARPAPSAPVIVAVIDTGIDLGHPDLRRRLWTNPAGASGGLHGFDFHDDDGNPTDHHGHGTHVAGIISAEGGNRIGVAGLAWNADVRLMALKVSDDAGIVFPRLDPIADAVAYAVEHGARVINMSFENSQYSEVLSREIERAATQQVLVVAAAGNKQKVLDGPAATPVYPASYPHPNLISVLAVDRFGDLWFNSNRGAVSVDLAAPGSLIKSTQPGGRYDVKSGTSFAAPLVAAGVAEIIARDPRSTADGVKQELLRHARSLPSLQGFCLTGGTLDLTFLGSGDDGTTLAGESGVERENGLLSLRTIEPLDEFLTRVQSVLREPKRHPGDARSNEQGIRAADRLWLDLENTRSDQWAARSVVRVFDVILPESAAADGVLHVSVPAPDADHVPVLDAPLQVTVVDGPRPVQLVGARVGDNGRSLELSLTAATGPIEAAARWPIVRVSCSYRLTKDEAARRAQADISVLRDWWKRNLTDATGHEPGRSPLD